jgi:hypothetical protein
MIINNNLYNKRPPYMRYILLYLTFNYTQYFLQKSNESYKITNNYKRLKARLLF